MKKKIIWTIITIIILLILSFIVPVKKEQEQEWVNWGAEWMEVGSYFPIIKYYNIYGIKIKEENIAKEIKENKK